MQPNQGKRAIKILSCGGCGCILSIFAFIGVILYITVFSNVAAKWMGEETYAFKSDTRNLDPFKALSEVRDRVGKDARLTEIRASYVRSDGTMDLMATYKPAPNIDYKFLVPSKETPENAPPVGAGRSPGDQWAQTVTVRCYEPGQRRHVTRISGNSRSSYSYRNEGMDIDRGTPSMQNLDEALPDPKLTTQEMWKIALEKGADKNAVAIITYDEDGYDFTISGMRVSLHWDIDGKFDEDRSSYPNQDRGR